jgi:hypothetical protein
MQVYNIFAHWLVQVHKIAPGHKNSGQGLSAGVVVNTLSALINAAKNKFGHLTGPLAALSSMFFTCLQVASSTEVLHCMPILCFSPLMMTAHVPHYLFVARSRCNNLFAACQVA